MYVNSIKLRAANSPRLTEVFTFHFQHMLQLQHKTHTTCFCIIKRAA